MLIVINSAALGFLRFLETQEVEGERRYYYCGSNADVPIVLVARGKDIKEGQVWDALSGNETGFEGFCLPEHEEMLIGKLTLVRLVEQGLLSEDSQVIPLSFQMNHFRETFLPLRSGPKRGGNKRR